MLGNHRWPLVAWTCRGQDAGKIIATLRAELNPELGNHVGIRSCRNAAMIGLALTAVNAIAWDKR